MHFVLSLVSVPAAPGHSTYNCMTVLSHLSKCTVSCPLVCVRSRHREQITTTKESQCRLWALSWASVLYYYTASCRYILLVLSVPFLRRRKLSSIQDYGSRETGQAALHIRIQIRTILEGRIQDFKKQTFSFFFFLKEQKKVWYA